MPFFFFIHISSSFDYGRVFFVLVVVSAVALFLEIMTHFVVWKGKLYFRCSLFAGGTGEESPLPEGGSEASPPGYPSGGSPRGLLEHGNNTGGGKAEMPGGTPLCRGSIGASMSKYEGMS